MLAKDKETNESYRSYFDKVLDQYHLERLRGEKHGSVYETRLLEDISSNLEEKVKH